MRKYLSVGLMLASLIPLGVYAAAPAGSATTGLTCTKLAGTATWTPPAPKLGSTKTVKSTVKATGTVSGCTGTKGIVSGKFTLVSKATTAGNCTTLLSSKQASAATSSITWSNGKKSVSAKLTITPAGNATVKIGGKVSSGTQFVGKSVGATVVFTPLNGGCTQKDLSKASLALKKGTKFVIK